MEVNELMTGDWVTVTEDNNEFAGKVQAINAITNYCIVKVGGDWHGSEHDVFIEDMQPIPLTPEIMGKNCTLIEREYKFGEYPNILSIMYDSSARIRIMEGDCEYYGIEIKYVHELQHALRLAGIKKEIVL